MLFQPLHNLAHASENDHNKNDSKEVRMNLLQRQSVTIKVLNKKETQNSGDCAHHSDNVRMDYESPQPKPMPLNDKSQGELLMTVLVMCVHAQK